MVSSRLVFPAIALFVAIANCLPLRVSGELAKREQEVLERRVIPMTPHADSGAKEEHKADIEADIRTPIRDNMLMDTISEVGSIHVRQGPDLSTDRASGQLTDSKYVSLDLKGHASHRYIIPPGGVGQATANARHEALHQEIRDHDFRHREQTRLANAAKARMEEEQGHAKGHQVQIRDARRARASAYMAGKTKEVEEHDKAIKAHADKRDEHQKNADEHKRTMESHRKQAERHRTEAARKVNTRNHKKV